MKPWKTNVKMDVFEEIIIVIVIISPSATSTIDKRSMDLIVAFE
ncbi:hypothetical protein [Galbibacter mesophilus]|nr:hypothetical protein [Galbibacter mesophilus]